IFNFSVEGTSFSGTGPAGQSFKSNVSPDGSIMVEYKTAVPPISANRITGNARSRQLSLTISALNGCQYALIPSAAVASSMETGGEWAIGRWDGHVAAKTAAGDLRSASRSLIIRKNPNGPVACFWGAPEDVMKTPTQGCTIRAGTISLVTWLASAIELDRRA